MSRSLLLAATTLAGSIAFAHAALAEASTIRIEPRPYYGATITEEHGVRVWRPLPPTKYMIINPDRTPVNLDLADVHEHAPAGYGGYPGGGRGDTGYSPYGDDGYYGAPYGGYRGRARGHGRHNHRSGGFNPSRPLYR